MPNARVHPVFDESVRKICPEGYPRHPKGCPNFGKSPRCPPHAPLFWEAYDIDAPIFVVWNRFGFGTHVERMRSKHPEWSQAQLECCLYWQGKARKQLKEEIFLASINRPQLRAEACPEAMGVNITATMASIGVHLEWPPVNVAVQVALLAKPKPT